MLGWVDPGRSGLRLSRRGLQRATLNVCVGAEIAVSPTHDIPRPNYLALPSEYDSLLSEICRQLDGAVQLEGPMDADGHSVHP